MTVCEYFSSIWVRPLCMDDFYLPYSRKYWRSLNLAVWSQAAKIKILADLNLTVALRSVIRHYKHCERVYQGVLPSFCLRYLNKAVGSQIYKKYNWQHVNDELAIRTAREKGAGRGQERYSMYYVLRIAGAANIILADFNLAVSTPTAKLPNLNPHQIFRLYGIFSVPLATVYLICVHALWFYSCSHIHSFAI